MWKWTAVSHAHPYAEGQWKHRLETKSYNDWLKANGASGSWFLQWISLLFGFVFCAFLWFILKIICLILFLLFFLSLFGSLFVCLFKSVSLFGCYLHSLSLLYFFTLYFLSMSGLSLLLFNLILSPPHCLYFAQYSPSFIFFLFWNFNFYRTAN